MVEAHSINSEHKDLIHDVAFDYYGERMATCSTDQFVKASIVHIPFGCVHLKTVYLIFRLLMKKAGLGPRRTGHVDLDGQLEGPQWIRLESDLGSS